MNMLVDILVKFVQQSSAIWDQWPKRTTGGCGWVGVAEGPEAQRRKNCMEEFGNRTARNH